VCVADCGTGTWTLHFCRPINSGWPSICESNTLVPMHGSSSLRVACHFCGILMNVLGLPEHHDGSWSKYSSYALHTHTHRRARGRPFAICHYFNNNAAEALHSFSVISSYLVPINYGTIPDVSLTAGLALPTTSPMMMMLRRRRVARRISPRDPVRST
jgi:hypothetical protein